MARKTIDIGVVGNDGTGDSIRDSFRKVNDNFRELYSSLGLGERLKFTGLEDAPATYVGQNDPATGNTPVVTLSQGWHLKNLSLVLVSVLILPLTPTKYLSTQTLLKL
jgi:hypothetical protein